MGHRADFLVARVVGHGPENLTKRDPSAINEAGPRYQISECEIPNKRVTHSALFSRLINLEERAMTKAEQAPATAWRLKILRWSLGRRQAGE